MRRIIDGLMEAFPEAYFTMIFYLGTLGTCMVTWLALPFVASLMEILFPRLHLGSETTWMDDVSKKKTLEMNAQGLNKSQGKNSLPCNRSRA